MKVAALIPHYDHAGTLPTVVSAMRAQGLPVLIVDDASPERCRPVLDKLAGQDKVLVIACTLAVLIQGIALFGHTNGFFYGVQLDMTVGMVLLQPIACRR